MTATRSAAIDELVSCLETFEIDYNQYYGDLEPQWFCDHALSGELDALACFCERVGWLDLAGQVKELLPVRGSAMEALARVRGYALPEIRYRLEKNEVNAPPHADDRFWQLLHARINEVARRRFESKHFADAVEASFKEVNDQVKETYRQARGKELDGSKLMQAAFSASNPVIRLTQLGTETERGIQQGYMQIFAGAMTGIRNQLAHANVATDEQEARHLICLASLLMFKIDSAVCGGSDRVGAAEVP